jgi:regulatory protein
MSGDELDFKKALNYAFLLLKYRGRSRKEMASRLAKKQFDPKVIALVLAYLEEKNYINDDEFVVSYVRSAQEKKWGPRKIKFYLARLGVKGAIVDQELKDKTSQKKDIKALIEKKKRSLAGKKNIYQKIMRHLVSRGFEYEDIIEAMEKYEN